MPQRPNLLIVHTDQQSAWTLGAYGGRLVGTPHADRLAAQGACFTDFIVNSAVCTPSRGCMLTGRYPHCHGAYHNNMAIGRKEVTLAAALAAAGYDTGYVGKWHLDEKLPGPGWIPPERSMGFADCRWMFNCSHHKSVGEGVDASGRPAFLAGPGRGHAMTDWLADRALEFIAAPRRRPFFLMLGIPDPHEPYEAAEPYASMFRPEDMPVPATFREENRPEWARDPQEGCCAIRRRHADDPEAVLRRSKAAYCAMVKCIDDNLGRLLAALEQQGLEDDTVVVFTTDHGDYMGEHGLFGKNLIYEAVYRVPLLVRWPGRVRAGAAVRRVLSSVDFMPTMLGLLGLPPAGREQGRDGSPFLLGGQVPEWADEAFIHHSHFNLAGVFTPEWELGLVRDGEPVLFDRRRDPEQARNLAAEPALRPVVRELAARTREHHRRLASPAAEWLEAAGR